MSKGIIPLIAVGAGALLAITGEVIRECFTDGCATRETLLKGVDDLDAKHVEYINDNVDMPSTEDRLYAYMWARIHNLRESWWYRTNHEVIVNQAYFDRYDDLINYRR